MTSRRNPSNTMRIFSSDVYLPRVAVLDLYTKELVSSACSSAISALSVFGWAISVFTKNGGVFGIALSPVLATITKKGAWDLPNFCQSEVLTTGARGRTSRPPSR